MRSSARMSGSCPARPRRSGVARVLLVAGVLASLGGCATVTEFGEKITDTVKDATAAVTGRKPEPPGPPTVAIEVEGVPEEVADNVRAHLALAAEPCDAPRWRITRRFNRSDDDVRQALRAFGFYRPTITKTLDRSTAPARSSGAERAKDIERPKDRDWARKLESVREDEPAKDPDRVEDAAPETPCWRALYRVDPGEQVTVAAVEFEITGEASDDPEFAALRDTLPVRPGDPLNHQRYEEAKRAVQSLAAQRGYLDARFERSELRVDVDQASAVARLEFHSGRRYRFGELLVEQDVLEEDLVRRLMSYREGDPYDSKVLAEVNRQLSDSGYFGRVEVRPRLEEPEDDTVPVDVRLDARKQHSFSAALGVTTDTGPRARLGYENRRLNRRGHRLGATLTGSLIEREANAEYRIPLADPRSEWLSFQAGYRQEDTDTSESETYKLGVRQTRQRFADILETRFLDLTREDFEVGSQRGVATLVVPGLSWSRTVSDGQLRPMRGHRWSFEVRGSHDTLGSDATFGRIAARAGWVHGFGWGGRVLTRADLGATVTDEFSILPPSQRFFAGGDTSVRGYGFQELGPEDANGDVIGGKYLGVVSLEYEHPIRGAWSAAAFVDAGNAFDDDISLDDVAVSIGAGIRWQSPIGPVRVDLAHPLDEDEPLLRLHLRLGPDL